MVGDTIGNFSSIRVEERGEHFKVKTGCAHVIKRVVVAFGEIVLCDRIAAGLGQHGIHSCVIVGLKSLKKCLDRSLCIGCRNNGHYRRWEWRVCGKERESRAASWACITSRKK